MASVVIFLVLIGENHKKQNCFIDFDVRCPSRS